MQPSQTAPNRVLPPLPPPSAFGRRAFLPEAVAGALVGKPNVDCIDRLRSRRPGDTVLNVGVGITAERSADFYRLTAPQLNTFDKEEAERVVRDSRGKVALREVVKMPLVPINDILAEHFGGQAPDFLSIDVEGLDYPILRTLDFSKYRPRMICAELRPWTAQRGGRRVRPGTELRGEGNDLPKLPLRRSCRNRVKSACPERESQLASATLMATSHRRRELCFPIGRRLDSRASDFNLASVNRLLLLHYI